MSYAVSKAVYYRWGPVTSKERVSSLVDEAGYFYNEPRIPEFLQSAITGPSARRITNF